MKMIKIVWCNRLLYIHSCVTYSITDFLVVIFPSFLVILVWWSFDSRHQIEENRNKSSMQKRNSKIFDCGYRLLLASIQSHHMCLLRRKSLCRNSNEKKNERKKVNLTFTHYRHTPRQWFHITLNHFGLCGCARTIYDIYNQFSIEAHLFAYCQFVKSIIKSLLFSIKNWIGRIEYGESNEFKVKSKSNVYALTTIVQLEKVQLNCTQKT